MDPAEVRRRNLLATERPPLRHATAAATTGASTRPRPRQGARPGPGTTTYAPSRPGAGPPVTACCSASAWPPTSRSPSRRAGQRRVRLRRDQRPDGSGRQRHDRAPTATATGRATHHGLGHARGRPRLAASRWTASRSSTVTPPTWPAGRARAAPGRCRSAVRPCTSPPTRSSTGPGTGGGAARGVGRRHRPRPHPGPSTVGGRGGGPRGEHGRWSRASRARGRRRAAPGRPVGTPRLHPAGRDVPVRRTSPWSRSTPRPGQVSIVRHVAVDDAGRVISPLIADGQVHGGLAQGIAQALLEEVRYDADGNPAHSELRRLRHHLAPRSFPSFELDQRDAHPRSTPSGRRASASPAPSAPHRRCTTRWSTPWPTSACATSTCRAPPRRCGGDPLGTGPCPRPRRRGTPADRTTAASTATYRHHRRGRSSTRRRRGAGQRAVGRPATSRDAHVLHRPPAALVTAVGVITCGAVARDDHPGDAGTLRAAQQRPEVARVRHPVQRA